MTLGNIFVGIILSFILVDLYKIIFKKQDRINIIMHNKRLDELRAKPLKTIEEQQEFLDLCFPKKRVKYKFRWMDVVIVIKTLVIFIGLMLGWSYLFKLLHIELSIMFAIFILLTLPLAFNWVLSKFGLNKHNSLMHLLGLGRKK